MDRIFILLISVIISFGVNAAGTKKIKPEVPLQKYSQYDKFVADSTDNKFIILNRRSQQLVLIINKKSILEMKVVVGQNKYRTPLGKTRITHVITNPYWNVPNWITKKELIPKFRKPNLFIKYKKRGFQVVIGEKVFDLDKALEPGLKNFRVRQIPGPDNTLGRVKFRLENVGGVYLHDTNQKELFKKANRRFSHGCVRLEKPLQLLEKISIIKYVESKSEKWYKLSDPVPVYIVNWKL